MDWILDIGWLNFTWAIDEADDDDDDDEKQVTRCSRH